MHGLLLIDKPIGWTSFDAVNYVRGMIARLEGKKPRAVKVGHTGTLDPFASGLLVLLVGSYTKRAVELVKQTKAYEATLQLGVTSTTDDPEGELSVVSALQPTAQAIREALAAFVGEITQTPPAYSAVKVAGQRAYKLARKGQAVDMPTRTVHVAALELVDYRYPTLQLRATVSSGTYIRSLARDIGEKLGTGAYVTALKRTQVGPYHLADAVQPTELTEAMLRKTLAKN